MAKIYAINIDEVNFKKLVVSREFGAPDLSGIPGNTSSEMKI